MENKEFIKELQKTLEKYSDVQSDPNNCAFVMVYDGNKCDIVIDNFGRVANLLITMAKQDLRIRKLIETIYDEM